MEGGAWSKDVSSAIDFQNITAAIAAEQKFNLQDAEMLLMMEDKPSRYDVTLPLGRDGHSKRKTK